MKITRRSLIGAILAAPIAGVAGWFAAKRAKADGWEPIKVDPKAAVTLDNCTFQAPVEPPMFVGACSVSPNISGFAMNCKSMGTVYDSDGVQSIWADGKCVYKRA